MKRVTILYDFENFKAGWGVAVEDGTAAMWQAQGKAIIGPDDLPLKKGNLNLYNGCTPLTAAEVESKKSKAPPPVMVEPEPEQ